MRTEEFDFGWSIEIVVAVRPTLNKYLETAALSVALLTVLLARKRRKKKERTYCRKIVRLHDVNKCSVY